MLLLIPLLALLTGSLVYCVLTVVAARNYLLSCPRKPATVLPPISILKPLAGLDEGLEHNLRSFFEQDYPVFEILFAVRSSADPAIEIVRALQAHYPQVPSRLIVTGEPPCANAKVCSLANMLAAAQHELVVMSDSDVRVTPLALATLAAELQDPAVGVSTCPYRAVPGRSVWSILEAIGLNTEFIGGVVVSRMVEGMGFAIGPTIATRKAILTAIGGFEKLQDRLAEDFLMGKLAAAAGYGVVLSSYVIEHRIGAQQFGANLQHRLRWNRSSRYSRPWGYIGLVFTNPLPLALLLTAVRPSWWPLLGVTAAFRAAAAWAIAERVLHDPLTRRLWWLVPVQDLASFLTWMAGFFGHTISWRGRKYRLGAQGRIEVIESL